MATQCPQCGQIHPSDPGDRGDSNAPPCCSETQASTSVPEPVSFILDHETSAGQSDGPSIAPPEDEAPSGASRPRIPWEDRDGPLDLKAYWHTTCGMLLHPVRSFTQWGPPTDTEGALLFLVIFGSLGQILGNYWLRFLETVTAEAGAAADDWVSFALFILQAPFLVLVSTFLSSVVIHFFLVLLRASSERWSKTFALFAYLCGALACLQVIPVLGLFIAPFWGLVVSVVGLRELHQTSTGKVVAAFLLPLALLLTVLFILTLLIISAGLVMLHNLPWP